jgi:hypothetical protein
MTLIQNLSVLLNVFIIKFKLFSVALYARPKLGWSVCLISSPVSHFLGHYILETLLALVLIWFEYVPQSFLY